MNNIIWIGDPVLVSFKGFSIHWYGVLFTTALLACLKVVKTIYEKEGVAVESLDTLFVLSVTGMVIGARLVHCFFYDPVHYFANPLRIIAVWEGGLASHGGGLGLFVAVFIYCKITKLNFFWVMDRGSIGVLLIGFFIRLGNFFNSEILGSPSDLPWAIVFNRIDTIPRHPVQLYESFSYLALFFGFVLMYKFTDLIKKEGVFFGLALSAGVTTRFLLEFFKVRQASYTSDLFLSTGQLLSIPFLIGGIIIAVVALKQSRTNLCD